MNLAHLIDLARWASAMDEYSTLEEYEDIKDFAKTWHDLLDTQLEDLHLSRLDLEEQESDYLSIGGCKL